ncbi:GNAT family N-acetyltransferase [Haladaptatus sp. YSMS36]|uniref:GNAT family N-acetyltransferase n=1 Tax=Haladaptatus sp. YSMS36 TaxID=3033384 RepID=UPI0023E8935D|nr:GNAT family N-acetyltransferase [Haladaptatus sp. YSMS36]
MAAPVSICERLPSVDEFLALREAADMAPCSREAVERGLSNSVFGVVAVHDETDEVVGMGRIVGDDGSVYHICDMAVQPELQEQGIGSRIMDALMAYIEETAPPKAYVNLMADVDGFYERWGFERTAPASKGMYRRTE